MTLCVRRVESRVLVTAASMNDVFHFFWCFLFSCFGWKVNISSQHGSDAGDLLLLVHHKVTRGVGLKWKIVTSISYRRVTPFGQGERLKAHWVWQAEADTELTLCLLHLPQQCSVPVPAHVFFENTKGHTFACTRKTPGPKRITHRNRKNDDIKKHKQLSKHCRNSKGWQEKWEK